MVLKTLYTSLFVFLMFCLSGLTNLSSSDNEVKKKEEFHKFSPYLLDSSLHQHNWKLYHQIAENTSSMPEYQIFFRAMVGYFCSLSFKKIIHSQILTIVDFSLPSTQKRLWVLDIAEKKVLFHTYVSHGKNSGWLMAERFSNVPNSNTSSLGFYATSLTYYGKHGLSLYIDGLEKGFNDKARDRAIVIHGADYVSKDFVQRNGRLGRSLGCPALPMGLHKEIIECIKNKSLFFIYHPSESYWQHTTLQNMPLARKEMLQQNPSYFQVQSIRNLEPFPLSR